MNNSWALVPVILLLAAFAWYRWSSESMERKLKEVLP